MTQYLVTWQIFVEARSPEEAARDALAAQRNADSEAICFDVRDDAGHTDTVVVGEVAPPVRCHLRLVKTSHA
jgi:hypothetical protein